MSYLLIAILTQIIIILLLFNKDILKKSNERYIWFILGITFSIIILKFIFLTLNQNTLYQMYSPAISIAIAPLLYFYVKNEQTNITSLNSKHILHFTPTILLTIAFIIVGIFMYFFNNYSYIQTYKKGYNIVFFTSFLLYHPLCFSLIYKSVKNNNKTLKWLIIPLCFWIIGNICGFLNKFFKLIDINFFLFFNLVGLTFFLIIFLKIKYQSKINESINTEVKNKKTPKYVNSSLTSEDSNHIIKVLQNHMDTKKPYLNSEFSLSILSKQVNISKHHITEALNTSLEKKFFLFVNEYKIAEAKIIMNKNKNEKLQTVAHFCGFNSKTTFIKYFKQIEGITPSQYRKQLNDSALEVQIINTVD